MPTAAPPATDPPAAPHPGRPGVVRPSVRPDPRRDTGRRPRLAAIIGIAAALVLLAGGVGWLGSKGSLDADLGVEPTATGSTAGAGREAGGGSDAALKGDATSSAASEGSSVAPDEPADPGRTGATVAPKIVRTGSVDLVVKHHTFADAGRDLRAIAEGAGGYVAASETSSHRGTPTGSLTMRVPADRFDDVVIRVGRLGVVSSSDSSSQDVTGEYTDLRSRLRAANAEREQILLVLGEARSVPEILQVRDRLDDLQMDIEEMQGRLKVLDDQTSLSTLTVSLRETGTASTVPGTPEERTGLAKAWHDAVDGFTGGLEAVVAGSGIVAFLALLALVGWLVGRLIWRRIRPDRAVTDRHAAA